MLTTAIITCFVLSAGVLAASALPQASWPDASPPVVHWSTAIPAKDVQHRNNLVIVLGKGRLIALDADTGTALWARAVGNAASPRLVDPMLLLDGRVVLSIGNRLLILSADTGAEKAVTTLFGGSIRLLAGPPLVAVADWRLVGSVLLRIDEGTGTILARRRQSLVDEIWLRDHVLLSRAWRAALPGASQSHSLTALSPSTLQVLWRLRASFPRLHEIDDAPFVSFISSHDRGGSVASINLMTGALAPPLPRRDPVSSEWWGSSWDLEDIAFDEWSSTLRRNSPATGRPVWTASVPFAVTGFRRERETLTIWGNTQAAGYVALLDWASGRPQNLIGPLPTLRDLVRNGHPFIAWTLDGRLFSFH